MLQICICTAPEIVLVGVNNPGTERCLQAPSIGGWLIFVHGKIIEVNLISHFRMLLLLLHSFILILIK